VLICELNTFYLKFVMWAPPEHPMVLGRMWFVAVAGAVAVREAYDFLMGVTADIGQSAWIAVAVIITGMVRNTSPTLFLSKVFDIINNRFSAF
jgi:phosphatidylserine synthase 2